MGLCFMVIDFCEANSADFIVFQQKLLLWRSVLIWTEKQGTVKSGQPKTPLHVLVVRERLGSSTIVDGCGSLNRIIDAAFCNAVSVQGRKAQG
ncbi:hypothetical protein CQZ93_07750 [Ochrobactrum vermis]|nr:hypothetical protein CQZ93_07750 [Ochrobactrum vermis]